MNGEHEGLDPEIVKAAATPTATVNGGTNGKTKGAGAPPPAPPKIKSPKGVWDTPQDDASARWAELLSKLPDPKWNDDNAAHGANEVQIGVYYVNGTDEKGQLRLMRVANFDGADLSGSDADGTGPGVKLWNALASLAMASPPGPSSFRVNFEWKTTNTIITYAFQRFPAQATMQAAQRAAQRGVGAPSGAQHTPFQPSAPTPPVQPAQQPQPGFGAAPSGFGGYFQPTDPTQSPMFEMMRQMHAEQMAWMKAQFDIERQRAESETQRARQAEEQARKTGTGDPNAPPAWARQWMEGIVKLVGLGAPPAQQPVVTPPPTTATKPAYSDPIDAVEAEFARQERWEKLKAKMGLGAPAVEAEVVEEKPEPPFSVYPIGETGYNAVWPNKKKDEEGNEVEEDVPVAKIAVAWAQNNPKAIERAMDIGAGAISKSIDLVNNIISRLSAPKTVGAGAPSPPQVAPAEVVREVPRGAVNAGSGDDMFGGGPGYDPI